MNIYPLGNYEDEILVITNYLWQAISKSPILEGKTPVSYVFFLEEAHKIFRKATKELINNLLSTIDFVRTYGSAIYLITHDLSTLTKVKLEKDGARLVPKLQNRILHCVESSETEIAEATKMLTSAPINKRDILYDLEEEIVSLPKGQCFISFTSSEGILLPPIRTKIRKI